MIKRQTVVTNTEPHSFNDDIHVSYELEHGRDVIKPGSIIKFKGVRGTFVFRCMAHNVKIDSTWIDCYEVETRSLKSFHIEKLIGVVKPKRSRRNKPNV